jgi:hypothetical protein
MCANGQFQTLNQLPDVFRTSVAVSNPFITLYQSDVMWAVFLVKEAFFISVPALYLAIIVILAALSLALSPLLFGYYYCCIKDKDYRTVRGFFKIIDLILDIVAEQAMVHGTLLLNLSTSYRCLLLAQQLYNRDLNASIKDFGKVMTVASNITFDLCLLITLEVSFILLAGSLSLSLSFSLSLSLSLSLSFSLSLALSLSRALSLPLSRSGSLTLASSISLLLPLPL